MNGLDVRRDGGGGLEGKEGRLYAAVGVFLGCMPFVLGSRGAARGGSGGSQIPGPTLVGEGRQQRRRVLVCPRHRGLARDRGGAQIHFHKSFSFLTSHQGYALGSRRRRRRP